MGAVLGVATLSYLPFAFFNIFSPMLSVLYGFTGFRGGLTALRFVSGIPVIASFGWTSVDRTRLGRIRL